MTSFRMHFARVMADQSSDNDLASFWLRKTKKPVLAVLLVQKENGEPKLYRGMSSFKFSFQFSCDTRTGTNMEVSMPTGSLCAERNVIGSALADDITLTRRDLRIIAVYSASMRPSAIFSLEQLTQPIVASPSLSCGVGTNSTCSSERIINAQQSPVQSGSCRSPNVGAKRKIMNWSVPRSEEMNLMQERKDVFSSSTNIFGDYKSAAPVGNSGTRRSRTVAFCSPPSGNVQCIEKKVLADSEEATAQTCVVTVPSTFTIAVDET